MSPPMPFVLIIYLVSVLEKICCFLEMAVFHNQVALLGWMYKDGEVKVREVESGYY